MESRAHAVFRMDALEYVGGDAGEASEATFGRAYVGGATSVPASAVRGRRCPSAGGGSRTGSTGSPQQSPQPRTSPRWSTFSGRSAADRRRRRCWPAQPLQPQPKPAYLRWRLGQRAVRRQEDQQPLVDPEEQQRPQHPQPRWLNGTRGCPQRRRRRAQLERSAPARSIRRRSVPHRRVQHNDVQRKRAQPQAPVAPADSRL